VTVDWAPLTHRAAMFLWRGAVMFVILGYVLSVMVMRVGEISFVAPFRYTSLIWSLILGYLVFAELARRADPAGRRRSWSEAGSS
jgi:drug/metabolite transporter (DMT)-like permease